MKFLQWPGAWLHAARRLGQLTVVAAIVSTLAACSVAPPSRTAPPSDSGAAPNIEAPASAPGEASASAAVIVRGKSQWRAVSWADVPGWGLDPPHEVWNAWIRSCGRPAPPWQTLCSQVRRLAIADATARLAWMQTHLQPYRVEPLVGNSAGLLTGYYEPVLEASRQPSAQFATPLWQPPADLAQRKPWFTRQEIDTVAEAREALRGREIAYLSSPIDALVLQIQGSGRLRITEPDGSKRLVRLAFAGTNEQPYRSVGRWLLDQNLTRDASWPGIKAWTVSHPGRVQEMLWSNPRMVFFREEAIEASHLGDGPRGAQGVPLTAGRSIAVDRESIPLGTPVWLHTRGEALNTQRLVLAQDVGSAIVGAVRADYYVGSGDAAGDLAGRLKQGLQLWALWPK